MQKNVALSDTKSEMIGTISNAHDKVYVKRLLESVGLKVLLLMLLELYTGISK